MTDLEELEKQLEKTRGRLVRALRRKDEGRLAELAPLYGRLKGEFVSETHRVAREAARARRAVVEAQERPAREVWKLPFRRSSGAVERDRLPAAPAGPQVPVGGLRPWRGGYHPAAEVIWRPGA